MNQELEFKLLNEFPKLYSDRYFLGFECGDGWFPLIRGMSLTLQEYVDNNQRPGEEVTQVVIEQVKEKFGSLRVYAYGGDRVTTGMVEMIESISGMTCETCGQPGKLRGNNWLYTACDAHTKEMDL